MSVVWCACWCSVDEPLGTGALTKKSRSWRGRGDGLAPLPLTLRELEAGGVTEGDVGHRTSSRPGDKLWSGPPGGATVSAQQRANPTAGARM